MNAPAAGALALFLAWSAPAAALRAAAQERAPDEPEDRTREAPTSEGALDNDVFVPVSEAAAKALESGDRALERARAARPEAEAARLLDVAFDHWREALEQGGAGASVWFDPTPGAERRVAEGVRAALVRRLLALAAEERARWVARSAPGAESAWAALRPGAPLEGREAALAEVVRRFPLTPAAARAALELGDLALEAGLVAGAHGWYAHAEHEAAGAAEAPLLAALAARRAALPAATLAADEPWERARALDFVASAAWTGPARRPGEDRWPTPGGAFTGDGRFAVQTPTELLLFPLADAGELGKPARVPLTDLLGEYTPELAFEAPADPPGWPLLPLSDAHGLVLVVGHTRRGEPNALLALEPDPPAPLQELGLDLGRSPPAARLDWAIVGAERLDASGAHPIPALEELGDYEFQPGPVACGDRILVQARQFDGQVRAWALAFDRRDGRLAWSRLLAAGADRVVIQRFARTQRRVAAQPPLALEPGGAARAFVGTHLGLGVLVDALLGEPLWSFKNRRRAEHEQGWDGDRPVPGLARDEPVVLWAPMDSDRLYTLAARPLEAGASGTEAVLVRPPAPLVEAQTLIGGDAEEHVVLGRMGRGRAVSARRAGVDRVDALDLGQDERFRGLGLVSAERVWVSTNLALYLFDRTRELYLLDREALPPAGNDAPGGDLHARGAHVLVLGSSALWSFRAR